MWKCKENCQRRDDNAKHGCDDNKQLIDCLIYELEQANEKLAESNIANVMSSLLDAEIEKVKSNKELTHHDMLIAYNVIEEIRQSAISYQEIK